jgi:UTP--glucose-1-phosphate uridylyltransferase
VARLIEAHRRHRAAAAVAVTEVPDDAVRRYGIVVADPARQPNRCGAFDVGDVVEKPDPAHLPSRSAIAARYVLGPEVFAALARTGPDADGEIGLTEALRRVISEGGRVIAVPLSPGEQRHDIGTVEGYCRVFLEHALRHPEFGAGLRARAAQLLDDG